MSVAPSVEIVSVAWISALVGYALPFDTGVGQRLPGPWDLGDNEPGWAGPTYVTVKGIGGTPDGTDPTRNPTVQIYGWAKAERKGLTTPINAAENLLSVLRDEQYSLAGPVLAVTPAGYMNARIWDLEALTEPRSADTAVKGLAKAIMEMSMVYTLEEK